MTKYVTRKEFEELEGRIANLEGILQEQETKKVLKSKYHKIRLNLGKLSRRYEEAFERAMQVCEGPIHYRDNNVLFVNGLVIRELDRAGVPYEKIK